MAKCGRRDARLKQGRNNKKKADVPDHVVKRYASVLPKLLRLKHDTDGNGNARPVDIPLSADARALWIEFYNDHANEQHTASDDNLASAFSKLEGYAARFALILHLVRCATTPNDKHDAVALESVRDGIALTRWFVRETARVYAILRERGEDRERRRLVDLIEREGGSITVRELMRKSRRYRVNKQVAKSALNELVKAGYGRWHIPRQEGPGRVEDRFVLASPAVDGGNGNTNTAGTHKNAVSVTITV